MQALNLYNTIAPWVIIYKG